MSLRVLVVDDASLYRRLISGVLAQLPGVEVVGSAANGKVALDLIERLHPDVITLDIEMPGMGGLDLLARLQSLPQRPAVIMLSSLTTRGGELTIRALEAGAFDFVTKPEGGGEKASCDHLLKALRPMLAALARKREILSLLHSGSGGSPVPVPPIPPLQRPRSSIGPGPRVVLIGVSTGGPAALAELVPALPRDIASPVLIVQHMPPNFTHALAERLQRASALRVTEAVDGETAESGRAYIAPGGQQMKVARGPHGEIVMRVANDAPENNCRPSVDYLFRSVALHFPGRAVAVILTGMGNDGASGVRLLKRDGSYTIAQDEASCVVFGMPREAIATGAIDCILPLRKIPEAIARAVQSGVPA